VDVPRLQAIVDVDIAVAAGWRPDELAEQFLTGGARWLQVRAKGLPSGRLLDLCDRIVTLAGPYGATVIVNDRVDLARLSGAGGVHLGQADLSPVAARDLLNPGSIIGYSTHTLAQVTSARTRPVSYVAVGPVFATGTKDTGYEAVGLELVRAAAAESSDCPVVGIGGITLEQAPRVLAAGAVGVAVITDLLVGGDPEKRVRTYMDALGRDAFS
jgi:thiamine-phosphate pyrophosphorylase